MLEKVRKNQYVRWLSSLILFVVVFILASIWSTRHHISGYAPAFSVYNLSGELHSFNFKEASKPKLLHFFATWCPICKLENDSLNNLSEDYEVIMIAMQSGSVKDILLYKQEHQLKMPIYNDEQGTISKLYKVTGVPASFIIDRNGKIDSSTMGYAPELGLRIRLWLNK